MVLDDFELGVAGAPTTDTSEEVTWSNEPDLIPEGDYEVFIEKAEKRTFKNGTMVGLVVSYRIRGDVDQGSKNRKISETLFQDRNNPKWFDMNRLKAIVFTQSNDPNYKVTFKNCDECIQFIQGLNLRIHVTIEDDISEVKRNRIKPFSYAPSQVTTQLAEGYDDRLILPDGDDLPF